MHVDVGLLAEWFVFFNGKYFEGKLPTPGFAVGRSRTRLGSLSWTVRRRMFYSSSGHYLIRISNYYDMDERHFKSVLLHEMIHLYVVSGRLRDTSPHGVLFRMKMREINADGWAVGISARMSGVPVAEGERSARKRVVLAVELKGGKRLFSVVSPAYVGRVDAALRRSPGVERHSWHVSGSDYFANFPTVRTPKGRVVDARIYGRMLAEMPLADLSKPPVNWIKK